MLLSLDTDILPKVRFIGYISYKEPWIHFSRELDEYVLYIIDSGELYIKEDGKEYALREGDFFLLEPHKPHVGFKKSCCSYYYVHFKHSKIAETAKPYNELIQELLIRRKLCLTSDHLSDEEFTGSVSYIPKRYNISNKIVLLYIFHTLRDAMEDYRKKYEYNKKIPSCKVLEILINVGREFISTEIERQQNTLPKTFVKAQSIIDYISKEYHKKISSEDIENTFESNYSYLNRIFQKFTGYTIFNYLNIVRINKAKELIETTPLKFIDIGYLVGIGDPYYFSKLFKKYMGMTPSQYLKKSCLRHVE